MTFVPVKAVKPFAIVAGAYEEMSRSYGNPTFPMLILCRKKAGLGVARRVPVSTPTGCEPHRPRALSPECLFATFPAMGFVCQPPPTGERSQELHLKEDFRYMAATCERIHSKSEEEGTVNDIIEVAAACQDRAFDVIDETNIIRIWSSVGARINLVGSVKMGLLIKKLDIDFHIYTDPFSLSDSFLAMSRLAANRRIRSFTYTNLLEHEDRCIEWHASYEDPRGDIWRLDMIHIMNESPYAGYFENVAERICAVLTPETREAILTIKNSVPLEKHVMGIEIYRAVIEGGIRDPDSFWKCKDEHPHEGIVTWCP